MTSKRSFIDMMKEDIKRRLWPIALSLTGFFFALPVLALIKLEDHLDSLNQGWDTLISLQLSFTNYTLGPGNVFAIAGLMIMAVLNGIHGMKYLHSRQEADFYGGIPVLRATKFNAAFVNGILIAVIPYFLMDVLAAIIGASKGFVTGAGFLFAFETMLFEIVGFILIYTVIVLAAVLTGHNAVTVAGAGVLSFVLLSYALLIEGYKSTFFITLYQNNLDYTTYLSPFTLFARMLLTDVPAQSRYGYEYNVVFPQAHTGYHMENVIIALVSIVISILIYVICLKLIKIRPAESAGKSMAFDKTKPVIKIIIMIPVAMTFGAFFPSITNGNSTYGWLVFGLIVGLILAHAAIEIIYEFDFKACIKHIPSGIIAAVITAAIVSFFVFDLSGYDTKLPERGRVESAAVYLSGIENSMYGKDYIYYGYDPYNGSDSDICMKNMLLTDLDDVYALAQAGCSYAEKYRWRGTAPSEDTENLSGYTEINVTMRTTSGSDFKRTYHIDTSDSKVFEALSHIYDTEEYKKNTYDILGVLDKMREDSVDIIRYETAGHTETASKVTDADIDRLLEAMAKETRSLTLDYLSEEAPVGHIEFEVKREKAEDGYPYYDTERSIGYVYPSFKDTLSVLEELGMNIKDKADPKDVDYIMVYSYDEETDGQTEERIDDRAEIEKLVPDLVDQDYASVNFAVFDVNYDPSYELHFKGSARDEYEGSNIEYCLLKK